MDAQHSPANTSGSRGFIHWFAGHPTAANLLMLIFLFMGLMTVSQLKRETFPKFTSEEVQISVVYPGATAEDVEAAICQRVEDALDAIPEVREITAQAYEGGATIVAEMVEGGEMSKFLSDVKTEVEAIADFPDQVEDPVVNELNRTELVLAVAVTGPMDDTHLKDYCESLKDRLKATSGVSQVEVAGFSDRVIRIEIPIETLRRYGLSVADIAETIANQSLDMPAGTLESTERDISVRYVDERRQAKDFLDLPVVTGSSGGQLTLGQIARVVETFDKDEQKVLINGRRAGLLRVLKTDAQDTLDVLDAVRAFFAKETLAAPPGVVFTETQNLSEIVQDRLSMLVKNGVQGLVLVFLAMWLFFSTRFAFWVTMGLPVSFMGAFFAMRYFDLSINMLTLVGLLLALGLLMDDAIVIAENVAAEREKGKNHFRAAADGAAMVLPGVFASYTTTLVVFGPLALMMEGNIGKVMWVMPAVLILTMTVSLVEAFCILPNHLAHAMHKEKRQNRFRQWFEGRFASFRDNVLGRAVDTALAYRYLTLGLALALLLIAVSLPVSGLVKFTVFPDLEGDVLEARLLMPQGTPLARTEAEVARLVAALERVDEAFAPRQPLAPDSATGEHLRLVQNINIQFNQNADAGESGPHVATVVADLLSTDQREGTTDEIGARWREEVGAVADALALTFTQPSVGPGGQALEVRLSGQSLTELKSAAEELKTWFASYRGVSDLFDDLRPGKPEVLATLKPGALALGLTARSLASQVRGAIFGQEAAQVQARGDSFDVDVRIAREDVDDLEALESLPIKSGTGELTPLSAVADLSMGRGWGRITRIGGIRTVTVKGDVDTAVANSAEIVADMRTRFLPDLLARHPGVSVALEGQAAEGKKTGQSMGRAFLVGIFGIFILLSFQFKSYLEPIAVMTAIPMALIGVIWGHFLLGLDLTMPSIMGFISLAGVVVNDSILLVEFIKLRQADGMGVPEAARTAARQRFRAILLTSLTTILGLLPLLAETSIQAQVLIPLAVSIVFGLSTSTLLVLFVVPSIYAIIADFTGSTKSASEPRA